jgi:hypothetical protein
MAGTRDTGNTNSTPSPGLAKDLRPFLDFPIEPDLQSEAAGLMVTLDEDAIETAGRASCSTSTHRISPCCAHNDSLTASMPGRLGTAPEPTSADEGH